MKIPEIALASYSLPPQLLVTGNAHAIKQYLEVIGADSLALMPARTRLTREIISHPNDESRTLPLTLVRQSYRGERTLKEVISYLTNNSLPVKERIKKFGIAAKSYIYLKHRDDSLEDVEHILSQYHKADAMYVFTPRAIQSARRVEAWDNHVEQRRLLQVTEWNMAALLMQGELFTTQSIQAALTKNGFTHLSFHNDTSGQYINVSKRVRNERLSQIAPLIAQYELTAYRSDLVGTTSQEPDLNRLAQGFRTHDTNMIEELTHNGAQIHRVVYAVPGHKVLGTETRKAIIKNLREF